MSTAVCPSSRNYRVLVVLSLVILVLTSVIGGLGWKHWELLQSSRRTEAAPPGTLHSSRMERHPSTGNFSAKDGTSGSGQIKSSIVEYLLFLVGATAIGVAVARDLVKRQ